MYSAWLGRWNDFGDRLSGGGWNTGFRLSVSGRNGRFGCRLRMGGRHGHVSLRLNVSGRSWLRRVRIWLVAVRHNYPHTMALR